MPPKKNPRFNYHDPPTEFHHRKIIVDKFGYLRFCDTGELIHRVIAYEKYQTAPNLYPLEFHCYVVHHKNGNKWDNRPCNLMLLTMNQHRKYHPHLKFSKRF